MGSFLNSPVWASVIATVGTMTAGIIAMISRLIGKVNTIGSKVDAIADDVSELKADQDIVRWSELARSRRRKGRNGL